jgi:hypothetical protein
MMLPSMVRQALSLGTDAVSYVTCRYGSTQYLDVHAAGYPKR